MDRRPAQVVVDPDELRAWLRPFIENVVMDQRSVAAEHFVARAREILGQPEKVAGHNGGIYIPDQEEFVRWCLGASQPTAATAPVAPRAEVQVAATPPVAQPQPVAPSPQPEGPPAWLGQVMNPILDRIEAIEQRIMTPPAYVPPVPTYQDRLARAPLSPFVMPFVRR